MTSDARQETDTYRCRDCGHIEGAPIDGVAGKKVSKTVGEGRRSKEIETVVCPECGSDEWNSDSVMGIFGDTDA